MGCGCKKKTKVSVNNWKSTSSNKKPTVTTRTFKGKN